MKRSRVRRYEMMRRWVVCSVLLICIPTVGCEVIGRFQDFEGESGQENRAGGGGSAMEGAGAPGDDVTPGGAGGEVHSGAGGYSGKSGQAGMGGSGEMSGFAGAAGSSPNSIALFSLPNEQIEPSCLSADDTYVYWSVNPQNQQDTTPSAIYRATASNGQPVKFTVAAHTTILYGTLSASVGGIFFDAAESCSDMCLGLNGIVAIPPGGGTVIALWESGGTSGPYSSDRRVYFEGKVNSDFVKGIWELPFSGGTPGLVIDPRQWSEPALFVGASIAQVSGKVLLWKLTEDLHDGIRKSRIATSRLTDSGTVAIATKFILSDDDFAHYFLFRLRGDWVYWVRPDVGAAHSIMRTPIDGGESVRVVGAMGNVVDLAVDDAHVYFIEKLEAVAAGGESNAARALRRVQVDHATGVEDIVTESHAGLRSIALSVDAVYWVDGSQIMGRHK